MPRSRKRSAEGGATSVSGTHNIIAPGGGTQSDISKLSKTLSLPSDTIAAIMSCAGQGVTRRSTGGGTGSQDSNSAATAAAMDPAMMNVWGDFMNEEMDSAPPPAPSTAAAATSSTKADSSSKPAAAKKSEETAPTATTANASGPRSYVLPIQPRMHLETGKKSKSNNDDKYDGVPIPGLLAQTGTLDASVPGRSAITKDIQPHELLCPTILFPSIFGKSTKIAHIATSPTSCHSIAITTDGKAYGWGRNENGQLGLGHSSAVVPLPTLLSVGDDTTLKFVGAGVGKTHTILVASNGIAYASGGNICGQLGINNAGTKEINKFRKCVVMGQITGDDDEGDDETESGGHVKIVQVSCGENISALLSSTGHLYTTGSSEFGQVGNGETGEYIVTAGRVGFSNCAKFMRRSIFVQSEADRDGVLSNMMTSGAMNSQGKVKCVSLDDSSSICLGNVSCGKNHIIAVEAPSVGNSHVPRVFSWGCGDYGCLGHGIQADEYTPRLIGAFRGPIFANNHPVSAVAGSNCSVVLTKHGHAYYVGKHKSAGEATMRFTLVDALANNGHVVASVGAGSQTVFCTTKSGVTVSWGNGSHGELGYGKDENKSSSKPKFVNGLDSCLVTSVACGMGHTLFIIRNEDSEDLKALKKVGIVEESDVDDFVENIKGKSCGEEEQSSKKKQKRG